MKRNVYFLSLHLIQIGFDLAKISGEIIDLFWVILNEIENK